MMDKEKIKENIKSGPQWLRFVFIIIFGAFFYVASVVLFFVVIFQFLHALFSGKPNKNVQSFGLSLGQYFDDIIEFLTYSSDAKPFPFTGWPKAGKASVAQVEQEKSKSSD